MSDQLFIRRDAQGRSTRRVTQGEGSGAGFSTSFAVDDADSLSRVSQFVDALSEQKTSRFDDMTKAEIRVDRLRARGLL